MNYHYSFHVAYYDGLNPSCPEQWRPKLPNWTPSKVSLFSWGGEGLREIALKTTYPGLLVGLGNLHSSQQSRDEIKTGFMLDYTTGLPVIPGSSVKGMLRSCFAYPQVIREMLGKPCTDQEIHQLEAAIFEGCDGPGDIFFDAFPDGDTERLLDIDFITPHKSPFKNPVPIRFLRIVPDVTIRFHFRLVDTELLSEGKPLTLSVEEKKQLFRNLLLAFGIGAKTNTGYGVLREIEQK